MASNTFLADITRFCKKARVGVNTVTKKIIFDVYHDVVYESPVGNPELWESGKAPAGYVGGRFRANWFYAFDTVPSEVSEERAPGRKGDGGADSFIERAQGLIGKNLSADARLKGGVHWIANNLPYAIPLEYGHSTQAPEGMVRKTAERFQTYLNKAASEL